MEQGIPPEMGGMPPEMMPPMDGGIPPAMPPGMAGGMPPGMPPGPQGGGPSLQELTPDMLAALKMMAAQESGLPIG